MTDPFTEWVFIDFVGRRDEGVTVAVDVFQEPLETLLPLDFDGVPHPAWNVLESTLAINLKSACGITGALFGDPATEWISVDFVQRRDEGIILALNVFQESLEPFLPLGCAGTPCPVREILESLLAISLKSACGIDTALSFDPQTELVAIDRVALRDAGVTVEFDVVQEPAEAFLPPG